MQITSIILAGGKSKRMGTDKSLLPFNGETLLKHSLKLCKPFSHSVIISSDNPNHKIPGSQIIPDKIKDCGPMGGIYSCLEKSKTDWNFVLSVDAIFIERAFISYLISETDDFDSVIPVHKNGVEPLIGMYNKKSLHVFRNRIKSGKYKMQELLELLNVNYIDAQEWVERYPQIFHNLNRPEDFNY